MELFDYNVEELKKIWVSKQKRQHAQLVILTAIGRSTDISVEVAHKILAELDDILEDKEEKSVRKGDPAL